MTDIGNCIINLHPFPASENTFIEPFNILIMPYVSVKSLPISSDNSVLPNFISERLNRWICASFIPVPLSATHTTNFPFTYFTFKMTNPLDVHL